MGPLIGARQVGGIITVPELGQMEEVPPMGVVQIGQHVEADLDALPVVGAPLLSGIHPDCLRSMGNFAPPGAKHCSPWLVAPPTPRSTLGFGPGFLPGAGVQQHRGCRSPERRRAFVR